MRAFLSGGLRFKFLDFARLFSGCGQTFLGYSISSHRLPGFEYVLCDFEFVGDGGEVAVVPYGGCFEVVGVDE